MKSGYKTAKKRYVTPGPSFLLASDLADFDQSWDPSPRERTINAGKIKFGKIAKQTIDGHQALCFDRHVDRPKASFA
jgi:hypothetical protein